MTAARRRVRWREMSAGQAYRALFNGGRRWRCAPGSEWEAFELRLEVSSRSASGQGTGVGLDTPIGTLLVEDATMLEVAGGVAFEPAWPAAVLADVARVAASRFDVELVAALGSAVAARGVGDVERVDSETLNGILTLVEAGACGRHSFRIQLPMSWLRWCLRSNRWESLPAQSLPAAWDDLAFQGIAWIAGPALHVSALRDLRVGDALLLPSTDAAPVSDGILELSGMHLELEWTESGGVRCRRLTGGVTHA